MDVCKKCAELRRACDKCLEASVKKSVRGHDLKKNISGFDLKK